MKCQASNIHGRVNTICRVQSIRILNGIQRQKTAARTTVTWPCEYVQKAKPFITFKIFIDLCFYTAFVVAVCGGGIGAGGWGGWNRWCRFRAGEGGQSGTGDAAGLVMTVVVSSTTATALISMVSVK